MAASFSASTSVINDTSKDQTAENVAYDDPPSYESLLNNTNTPNNCQYQAEFLLRNDIETDQPLIDVGLIQTLSSNQIETYKVWSILNILCCCLCLGFIACHYSTETEYFKKMGNIQGARKASKQARNLNILSTVIGFIILNVLYYVAKSNI